MLTSPCDVPGFTAPVDWNDDLISEPTIAEDEFDLGDATGTPPVIDLDWSCGGPPLALVMALEGRHWDGWVVPVTAAGGGEYDFDHRFTTNNVQVAGTVSTSGQAMTIEFSTLSIGGQDLGSQEWELSAI